MRNRGLTSLALVCLTIALAVSPGCTGNSGASAEAAEGWTPHEHPTVSRICRECGRTTPRRPSKYSMRATRLACTPAIRRLCPRNGPRLSADTTDRKLTKGGRSWWIRPAGACRSWRGRKSGGTSSSRTYRTTGEPHAVGAVHYSRCAGRAVPLATAPGIECCRARATCRSSTR